MIPISDGELKTKSRPYVNITLIIICIVVFIFQIMMTGIEEDQFIVKYGLIPAELTQGVDFIWLSAYGPLTTDGLQYLTNAGYLPNVGVNILEAEGYIVDASSPIPNVATVFTSMFMHGGLLHIIGNMLFLWVFGDNIEDKFGHFKYLLFYLASGIAAVALHIAIDTDSAVPLVGASGAIAGVLGAYIVLFPMSRVRTLVIFIILPIMVRIPAIILLGIWFLLQFFSGVGSLVPGAEGGGVAYWAHIGGFIVGIIVAFIYKSIKDQSRPRGPGGNDYDDVYVWSDDEPKYWRGRRL